MTHQTDVLFGLPKFHADPPVTSGLIGREFTYAGAVYRVVSYEPEEYDDCWALGGIMESHLVLTPKEASLGLPKLLWRPYAWLWLEPMTWCCVFWGLLNCLGIWVLAKNLP